MIPAPAAAGKNINIAAGEIFRNRRAYA